MPSESLRPEAAVQAEGGAPVDAVASITTAAWVVTVSSLPALPGAAAGRGTPMARKLQVGRGDAYRRGTGCVRLLEGWMAEPMITQQFCEGGFSE